MFNDVAAKHFYGILKFDSRIPRISFRMPKHKVDHQMFLRVADALKNGDIRVAVNTRAPKHMAMGYDRFNDVIVVPKAHHVSQYKYCVGRAKVVHEAVHAASDLDVLKVLELHDEAAAFLATYLYYLYAGVRDVLEEDAHLDTEGNGPIAVECYKIIDRFDLARPGQQFVPADACSRLAEVIAQRPPYDHLKGKLAGYDGVQGGLFRSIRRLQYATDAGPRQREMK